MIDILPNINDYTRLEILIAINIAVQFSSVLMIIYFAIKKRK